MKCLTSDNPYNFHEIREQPLKDKAQTSIKEDENKLLDTFVANHTPFNSNNVYLRGIPSGPLLTFSEDFFKFLHSLPLNLSTFKEKSVNQIRLKN